MADQKQILLTGHGLHRVDFTDTVPMPRACSYCRGDCPTPAACELPEATEPARRGFPAISGSLLVGALFAIPGVVLFAIEGIRLLIQH